MSNRRQEPSWKDVEAAWEARWETQYRGRALVEEQRGLINQLATAWGLPPMAPFDWSEFEMARARYEAWVSSTPK